MTTSTTSAGRLGSLIAVAALTFAASTLPAGAAPRTVLWNDTASTTCSGHTCTHEMANRLPAPQTFVVPEGLTEVTIELAGGPGGGLPGGALRTVVPVTPGETLTGVVTHRTIREEPVAGASAGGRGATFLFRGEGADAVLLVAGGGGRDADRTDAHGTGPESLFGDPDGGATSGPRFLSPGLDALEPAPETVEAADDFGRLAIQWQRSLPVFEPVLLDANGDAITSTLTTRTFHATGSGLPPGWRVRVLHGPLSSSINARYGRVGDDGAFDVPYTLHNQEWRGSFWVDVTLLDDDGLVAQERIEPTLPPVVHETVLTVPADVLAGAPTTVGIARTGVQFGEPTIGLAHSSIAYYLETGTARLLLDGEPLDLDDLTIPDRDAALSTLDALPVTFTAPAAGTHTLTVELPEGHRSGAVTTSTDLVVAAASVDAPTALVDPGTDAPAEAGVPTGPGSGAVPSSGAGALSALGEPTGADTASSDATPAAGGLAATGARVTGLGALALTLMGAGVALVAARRPHRAPARHAA